jgi:hypothetical protein
VVGDMDDKERRIVKRREERRGEERKDVEERND